MSAAPDRAATELSLGVLSDSAEAVVRGADRVIGPLRARFLELDLSDQPYEGQVFAEPPHERSAS